MTRTLSLAMIVLLTAAVAGVQAQEPTEPTEPIEVEKTEVVEVRLVLIDALVVDGQGRTVADLTADDFELIVDGESIPVDTFDVDCPAGVVDDPRGVRRAELRGEAAAPEAERKIVLTVDYMHLPQLRRVQVLEAAKEMVRHGKSTNEEIMVVALNGGLRIEQMFTPDREAVLRTLHRMEYDISLWQPTFHHVTDFGWFESLTALFDVLGQIPGTKAVVLFSDLVAASAEHDPQFELLAAAAGTARSTIYPVEAEGLKIIKPEIVPASCPLCQPLRPGGSPALTRLALDTGGRLTQGSNDLSLAYARAQRDLACRYTIGFYDDTEDDRPRPVKLKVRRPGLYVIHPSTYMFRSPGAQRESLLRAAFLAPELFRTGVVRTHIFPVRPLSPRSWETLLAISFPITLGQEAGSAAQRVFGAVLSRGPVVVHRFDREVTLRSPRPAATASDHQVTFLEPIILEPGEYTLSAVLSDPGEESPHTAEMQLEVPKVPKKELFFVGPILARPAGDNVVIQSGTAPKRKKKERGQAPRGATDELRTGSSFEPLLVQQVEEPSDLAALTQVCMIGSRKAEPGLAVVRSLKQEEGAVVGTLPPVELQLDGAGKVRCQNLLDVLPVSSVEPGRYVFEALLDTARETDPDLRERVRFGIGPPHEEENAAPKSQPPSAP